VAEHRTHPGGGLRLAVTALCLTLPACTGSGPSKSAKPAPLELTIGQRSLVGNFREFNDDALAVKELRGSTLCLAADGMGTKIGERVPGQVACERVFEVLTRELLEHLRRNNGPDETRIAVRRAVVAANDDLIALSARDPDLRNMGATIVLALWSPESGMYVAGVGDSRIYLVRGDRIEQLTVDQTIAQALVEAKTITAEEARSHRYRNVLWKFLGSSEVGDGPDVIFVPVQPGDRLLLTTKGIQESVSDEQMLSCLREHSGAQKCADALCEFALDAGSRGNVSCMVIDMAEKK
jgi:PPM family protein phosphatase